MKYHFKCYVEDFKSEYISDQRDSYMVMLNDIEDFLKKHKVEKLYIIREISGKELELYKKNVRPCAQQAPIV